MTIVEVQYVHKTSGEVIELPLVLVNEEQVFDLCETYGDQYEIAIDGERIV